MELAKEQKILLYKNMFLVRKMDEFLVKAVHDGTLGGPFFHSQQGQEAIGVGACTFLREDDYVWYTHRGHGLCEVISKGLPPGKFFAEHMGKVTGSCHGIGFINTCYPERGIFGMGGTVGGESTLASGVALASKLRGKKQVVCAFLGDGAIGEGSVHAAMLMSANWKLPVIWLCSNNGMSMFVPVEAAYPKENIADIAYGYNIPATIVDGQDVQAVYTATQVAIERARSGAGPSFLEFKTCRYNPQVEGIPDYSLDGLRSEKLVSEWKKRDPVSLYKARLIQEGVLSQIEIELIENEVSSQVIEAEKFAKGSPYPDPSLLDKALFAD
jgi:TPP-dependent pyruvate/acetoin dehydrogenase alpha subunit